MEELRVEMDTNPPLPGAYTPKKGDSCAAKYSEDKQWLVFQYTHFPFSGIQTFNFFLSKCLIIIFQVDVLVRMIVYRFLSDKCAINSLIGRNRTSASKSWRKI